ncbi:MAG: endolytic transglycosylase MltG [Bryobacteraceae bacterium]
MRALRRLATFLLFIALALLGAGGAALYLVTRPHMGFQEEALIDIPRGANARSMAALLEQHGVVASRWHFLIARALRPRVFLQAGEYSFSKPATAIDIFDRIARGDVFYYELKIPEGYNRFDIAAGVERAGIISAQDFLRASLDPRLIRDIAPDAPTLEGYLFPDTYRLTRHTTAADLCGLLTRRFRAAWAELATTAPVHRTVTLASLVEKETRVAEERPKVASVFANRLRIGMKLDCDPTVVYAALLSGRYRGTIYRSDLDSPHPYNTYRNAGLPPGPIANPGAASLKAAIDPEETEFLFFVALPGGTGRHQFSKVAASHEAAVARYRRGQNNNKKQKAAPARVASGKKPRSRQ